MGSCSLVFDRHLNRQGRKEGVWMRCQDLQTSVDHAPFQGVLHRERVWKEKDWAVLGKMRRAEG